MSWLESLKEGDQVILVTYKGTYLQKVQRLTATQVLIGGNKFNRRTGRIVGGSMYDHTSIREPTPELVEKAKLCSYQTWLQNLKPGELALPQLQAMYDALKGAK